MIVTVAKKFTEKTIKCYKGDLLMQKLMEYTGGSIILMIISICLEIIAISFITFAFLRNLKIKNMGKYEIIITIILMIFVSAFTGGTIGYYLGIFTMLR